MLAHLIFRLRKPASHQPDPNTDIFGRILPLPPRPWLPLFSSLAAHVVLLALVPFAADELSQMYADDIDWSSFRVETMALRVPEVIYFAAPTGAGKANANRPPEHKNALAGNARGNVAARQNPSKQPVVPLPKELELPSIQPVETDAAVLQPDIQPPASRRPLKLPPLAFWARRSNERKRDEVILPGRSETAAPPQLAAPPVLAVPNKELELADKNIAAAPPVTGASLPVAPSATAPVRDKNSEARSGAMDQFSGQSANVISLSSTEIRPGEVVAVPRGSAGSRSSRSEAPTSGDAGSGGQATNSRDAQPGPERPGHGSAAGAETASRRDNMATGDQSPTVHHPSFAAADGSNNVAVAHSDSPASAADTTGSETFKRIMHPPNGHFDVVVSQPASSDLQGVATRLSGSPVYSVYLQVGDIKEWVLAFCLPASKQSRNNPYEVFVEDASPLSPPYPMTTSIPQSIIGQPRHSPIAFRGFLTSGGTLRDLTTTEPGAIAQKIAATLYAWRFRPAKKNDVPTEVEILLILPLLANGNDIARSNVTPSSHGL